MLPVRFAIAEMIADYAVVWELARICLIGNALQAKPLRHSLPTNGGDGALFACQPGNLRCCVRVADRVQAPRSGAEALWRETPVALIVLESARENTREVEEALRGEFGSPAADRAGRDEGPACGSILAHRGPTAAAIVRFRDRGNERAPDIDVMANPLNLGTALACGAIVAIVLLALHYLEAWFGEAGIRVAAAFSGVTDVDAITISVARLAGDDLAADTAAMAIFVAAAVNTGIKAANAFAMGNKAMGLRVGSVYVLAVTAGVASFWFAAGGG